MNRILISGVAGFLGVNLALKLLENENNLVFGIDNFSNSSISNIYRILKCDRFNFLQQDIKDRISVNVDQIFHFVGCGDLKEYYNDKFLYCIQYIENIKLILEYSRLSGAKILFVTGYIENSAEDDLKLYFELLQFVNELILEYSSKYKINAKIARIDKVYGPNVVKSDCRFIPSTIIKAFNNDNIILKSDKSYYYTYCEDVVCGFVKLMNSYLDDKIIDVVFPNLSFDSDIAKLIINFTKSKSKIIIENNIQQNPCYVPDTHILNDIDFRCKTPILEGISKTIDYIKLMFFT